MTGISVVTVHATVDGEPIYDGECEVGENGGFTMVTIPLGEQGYGAVFVPKCELDTSGETPLPTPSDTSSAFVVFYPDLFGKAITVSIEANIAIPIPAKFLTEVPKVTVTEDEQVVGTYMGETLYERTYVQPIDTSGTVDTVQVALDDSVTYQFCYVDKCVLGVSTDGDTFEQTITNDYFESTAFMGATYNSGNVFVTFGSDVVTDTDKLYMLFVTVRYIKGEGPTPPPPPTRLHTVELPSDVQFTADGHIFGNIDDAGSLGLVTGNQYTMSATAYGQTSSVTRYAGDYITGVVALESGAELGYFNILDNGYYDYEDLEQSGAPKLKYKANAYCFRGPSEYASMSIYFDVKPKS